MILKHFIERFLFSCYIINETSLGLVCARDLLQRGHKIYGIVTSHQNTINWANKNNIKVLASLDELYKVSHKKQFDYLFSIVNSNILSKKILDLPKYFAINYHDSPLPKYAGVHSTSWAILNGEKFHGITWHKIIQNVDAGDILKQVTFPIYNDDTALLLNLRCYEHAIKKFSSLLDDIETDKVSSIPQNLLERSFFGLHKKPLGGGIIDWNANMNYISKLVKALHFGNYENNFTRIKIVLPKGLIIYPNRISFSKQERANIKLTPGEILSLNNNELIVSCKNGLVRLQEFLIIEDRMITLEEVIYISGIEIGQILPLFNNQQLQYFTDLIEDASKNTAYF